MFATIDNTVTLPGYTRVDAAAYFTLTADVRLQANVENALRQDVLRRTPTATRTSRPASGARLRVGLTAGF